MTTTRCIQSVFAAVILTFAATAAADDMRGTPEEARDMVVRAIAYYGEAGAEAALEKFNTDPAPEFLERDLYVFVFGPEGTIVAHAVDPSLLGRHFTSFVDIDGKRFGKEMRDTVTAVGTWVDYKWMNPATGQIAQKSSWLMLHDGYVFGVGVHKP